MTGDRDLKPENAIVVAPSAPLAPVRELPMDQRPARVYIASLAPGQSRRTMAWALETAGAILAPGLHVDEIPWSALRYHHVAALRAAVASRPPRTANLILGGVRGVIRAAVGLGQMPADTAHQILIGVKGVRGTRPLAGRVLPAGDISAFFGALGRGLKGARDGALFAMMYGCGLRRAELAALEVTHVHEESDGYTIDVLGKGNKVRTAHVVGNVARALRRWLEICPHEGPLFLPVGKGGKVALRHLTTDAVYKIVVRSAKRAKIAKVSPHDLRRTFATDLLDRGVDIRTVQQMMGHEHVQTTTRYDRRPEATRRRASEVLHVPITEDDDE